MSHISHCCIVFNSKQSTSLGCREKLSAAAAAATMSHYQLVNSLSDSLTASFIFSFFFHANAHLTLSGSLLFAGYALQVLSHEQECSCQMRLIYSQPVSEIKNNRFSRKWENLAGFEWSVINTGLNIETFETSRSLHSEWLTANLPIGSPCTPAGSASSVNDMFTPLSRPPDSFFLPCFNQPLTLEWGVEGWRRGDFRSWAFRVRDSSAVQILVYGWCRKAWLHSSTWLRPP